MWQKIKNIYHLTRAFLASVRLGSPSKKIIVIGVTGTDGKTTTAHMIYEILKASGKKVSLISSIFAAIGEEIYDTGFHVTTPNPVALQRFLKQMVDGGSEYAVLEVTSHGLDQNRISGINFTVGVLTNITHEHLDYHRTYANYLRAKSKLFKKVKASILNADDDSYSQMRNLVGGQIVTYGIEYKADFMPTNFPIKLQIPGSYNIYNALAATAVARYLGIDKKIIKWALYNFQNLTGRMEEVDFGQDFKVIVDFAHTPNALENALKSLTSQLKAKDSKLIAVFGAAGRRDKGKRFLMGEVSAKLSDYTVITDEDPRTENPMSIAKEVAKGCEKVGARKNKNYFIVTDRTKAIQFAIGKLAQTGDIVGIFGKGHEKSMCYGKTEYPWSDQEAAKQAIIEKLNLKL